MMEKITDKEFMKAFIKLANSSARDYGCYDKIYRKYEKEFSIEEIYNLLTYCDEKGFLKRY